MTGSIGKNILMEKVSLTDVRYNDRRWSRGLQITYWMLETGQ